MDRVMKSNRVFLPAIVSGLLLYVGFFPLNLGFFAWFALVPSLAITGSTVRNRRLFMAGFVGGLCCFLPATQWIRVAHPAMYGSWAFLFLYCSIVWGLGLVLIRRLSRRIPLWIAAPATIVALDYLKAHFPTGYSWLEPLGLRHFIGFAWYQIGHTQHDWLPMIQISDVAGVYGVTAVVVLVNVALLRWMQRVAPFMGWLRQDVSTRRPIFETLVALIAFTLVFGYGMFRLQHPAFRDGPSVALIQGNIPQDIKTNRGREMRDHFFDLCNEAVRKSPDGQIPELVVWPETSCTETWFDLSKNVDPLTVSVDFLREIDESHVFARKAARVWPTNVLFGLNALEWEAEHRLWKFNSAVLVSKEGTFQGRYDKMHLVPFGEYVPLEKPFPFMKMFTPYTGDYSCKPGESYTRFPLAAKSGKTTFGMLICYEDSDPGIARRYVESDPVDFLVNISNDGWFDGTSEHEEHLAITRFRAVETRRALVRAVNMGISAIIDSDGRVLTIPGETWSTSKKVSGIVRGTIPLDDRSALYPKIGDTFAVVCSMVLIIGFMISRKKVAPDA
jgi:apolipoprotein N-acyltransferase